MEKINLVLTADRNCLNFLGISDSLELLPKIGPEKILHFILDQRIPLGMLTAIRDSGTNKIEVFVAISTAKNPKKEEISETVKAIQEVAKRGTTLFIVNPVYSNHSTHQIINAMKKGKEFELNGFMMYEILQWNSLKPWNQGFCYTKNPIENKANNITLKLIYDMI